MSGRYAAPQWNPGPWLNLAASMHMLTQETFDRQQMIDPQQLRQLLSDPQRMQRILGNPEARALLFNQYPQLQKLLGSMSGQLGGCADGVCPDFLEAD